MSTKKRYDEELSFCQLEEEEEEDFFSENGQEISPEAVSEFLQEEYFLSLDEEEDDCDADDDDYDEDDE